MSQKDLKSINCTQCTAPLSLHGGHRVESITCGYCGAVLDTKEEYKVVKQYKDMKRPSMPLKLGAKGKIKGIEFTIIGVIEYQSSPEYAVWLEYMLFSPTHGYAWLVYDMGHFVFSRRVRDFPNGKIPKQYKMTFTAKGHNFRVYDYGTTTINYVEGELTWIAKKGDKTNFIEGISPPYAYSVETTEKEKEFSFGEYLDYKEVYDSFGVKDGVMEPYGVHGAQPYNPSALVAGLGAVSKYFLPLALILWLTVAFLGNGSQVFETVLSPHEYLKTKEGATRSFTVTNADHLIALNLRSELSNAWGWYDIEIRNREEPLFVMSKQISYYSGYEGGESWSEGSRNARALIKLPKPGEYYVRVWGDGGQGNYGNVPQSQSLKITIDEGIIVSRYYFFLFVIFLISFIAAKSGKVIFEGRRWGTDDE